MNSLMMISCWSKKRRSAFKYFGKLHFKLMFYYIDVRLLAHYTQ
jgi:hypothetical protein